MSNPLRSSFGLFADGPGKKVQASVLTDENGATVYRQFGVIADPDLAGGVMAVNAAGQASVSDVQSAPFAGAVAMVVGTAQAAQRSIGVLCTAAGNVEMTFSDGSTITLPVYVGWQTFPFAVTTIVASGTTATASYYNLK
jgi:hypothetical protein